MNNDNKFKVYMQVIKNKSELYIERNKKKLVKIGAVILSVITFAGGVLIIYRFNREPQINNKPAKVVEVKDEESGKSNLFLEHVEQLKSGIYDVSALVFGEENMRINETYGESSKNYVVVQGNFKVKYSIDVTRIKLDYNFDKELVTLKVPKDAVGVDSVELVGDIKEIERYESLGNKIMDFFPWLNENEELKEGAIRQLLRNSKIEANKYNQSDLQIKANKALKELVDTINLNNLKYEIKFVDSTKISIKK